MQVDSTELLQVAEASTSYSPSLRVNVPVDSPYDLDAVIANYEGRSRIIQLLFIANVSPSLAGPAYVLALDAIRSSTVDVGLYEVVFEKYKIYLSRLASGDESDSAALAWFERVQGRDVVFDRIWYERTTREAQSGLDRLEVELKGYTTNLIKESIRMGYRDLAQFQYRMGDLEGAVRSYTKSRDYCTTNHHVLEMCMGVIEVALDMQNYSFVRNYVIKAQSAADSVPQQPKAKAPATNLLGMAAPGPSAAESAKEREKLVTNERLAVANGVAHLGLGAYASAANALTSVGKESLNGTVSHFVPASDIALYAVMTALATFDRQELRRRVLENSDLRPMLDLEPYLRDILRTFHENKFREGLELLERHSARQLLDIHLSAHVPPLLELIRSRALVTYFSPYASVSLSRMANAFGYTANILMDAVVALIESGQLKARIDSLAGVLVARKNDARATAFKNALTEGEEMQRKTKDALLRMRLIQADIVVKKDQDKGIASQWN